MVRLKFSLGLATVLACAGLVSAFAGTAVAAGATPLVSTATSESGSGTVGNGTVLTATFNATPVLASSYSLKLTDGNSVVTLSSGAGTLSAAVSGASIAFTVHSSTSLSLSVLEILAATGVTDASGNAWSLVASGRVDKTTTCTAIAGLTRVFGGNNCLVSGPIAPDVYDVIPVPTQDLPGPPDDNAPEVITGCQAGSTDFAYDLNTGAQLGTNACGNNPNECAIGNTCGNTLDYMPTPNLASFEEVGVIETIPSSSYVSGTIVPPQLSAVTVSGSQATFSYYGTVVCQDGGASQTVSSFTYETPYTNVNASNLVYASSMTCSSSSPTSSITVHWASTIPVGSTVRFKYTSYGDGHNIVGAAGTPAAGIRAASESAYAGPSAAITSFTPKATTMPSSSGGSVNVSFATTNAHTCSISATSSPTTAAPLSLPSVASCNGSGAITVPANTSSTSAVYTVTLSATGVAGTPTATAQITITVPGAASSATLTATPASVAGGGTVTVSWSGVASPSPGDWVGLYHPGDANTAYLDWFYADSCTKTQGSGAHAAGSCTYTMPVAAGTYELRLFSNYGYTLLATSGTVTTAPSLTATPANVAGGGTVTVSWNGVGSPTAGDWVGLYHPGAANTAYLDWFYADSCTKTQGTGALASGSCTYTMPVAAGSYELRLFSNYSYTLLATSGTVTDSGAAATLTATPANVAGGGTVTVSWSGVTSPSAGDWVGLYHPGDANTAYLDWFFTDSCTKTQGSGALASGSCTYTVPVAAGTYELRLFSNYGYTLLATSGTVTTAPSLTASPANVAGGGTETLSWSGITSPSAGDWVGLYHPGAANTAYLDWFFTDSCTKTQGSGALASGSCTYTMPGAAGTYELRLFSNYSYTLLATSGTVTDSG